MIYCIKCMNMCSEDAATCPRCGHPLKEIIPTAQPIPRPQAILQAPPIPQPQAAPRPRPAVVKQTPVRKWSGGIAMVLSLIIPGLGPLYKGQPVNGLIWFGIVVLGYVFFIVPGLALHLCCILGAGMGNPYK